MQFSVAEMLFFFGSCQNITTLMFRWFIARRLGMFEWVSMQFAVWPYLKSRSAESTRQNLTKSTLLQQILAIHVGCEKCNETLSCWKLHPPWDCNSNHLFSSQICNAKQSHTLPTKKEHCPIIPLRRICCFISHMPATLFSRYIGIIVNCCSIECHFTWAFFGFISQMVRRLEVCNVPIFKLKTVAVSAEKSLLFSRIRIIEN